MSQEQLGRLLARDTSLWPDGNVAATRLGWLDSPDRMLAEADELTRWASSVSQTKVVLLGMGGSSLGPEVLRVALGSDRLVVLDTTDPATIAGVDLDDAFFLVSSKSGGTLEVQALLAHCWERVPDGSRYAAITDPGTALAELARGRGFSRVFENDPDIGGRYSVLSYFGLVPAALLGYDVAAVCRSASKRDKEEAAGFGVMIAEAALEGRDKLTIWSEGRYAAFGLWAEQLVAESTGKQGKGVVPVPVQEREDGDDRFLARVELGDPTELGGEFFAWEIATAIAGSVLEIDPFDEPNVTESKENTAKVLGSLPPPEASDGTADPATVGDWLAGQVGDGDYVSIQAYLPYGQDAALERLRRALRDRLGGRAVTAGFGPRFLHSTGQLHKGGANNVVAVQLVPREPTAELAIPGFPYDFGTLIAAQALGDHRSLLDHGRRVLRVAVDDVSEVS